MTTKILGSQITDFTIQTTQLSNTAVASFAVALAPKVRYANVANSAFTVLDDTAVNVGGGYIVITGSDFVSGAQVLIDTTPASAVTFVNSTTLRVQVPAKAAASYNLYVVNPDGGTGTRVSGLTYSTNPTWVTTSPLANQAANAAFSVNFSATGASTYSVASGSSIPSGTSLLANGYFYGTVTIGAETTYSFTITATDAELQDADKTFAVTVTVTPATRLWLWGANDSGQLGTNDRVYKSSPTQIGTETTWNNVSGGNLYTTSTHAMATKTDGTLWTWGRNSQGQLGVGNLVYRSSPTQVGLLTNWSKVSGGAIHSIAIKTDGTLWSWGCNNDGRLGDGVDGGGAYKSSPVQVGGVTTWSTVSTSEKFSAALRTDGTLWMWGGNGSGQLGKNNTTTSVNPTQISGTWTAAIVGSNHTVAVSSNGTLWAWGNNGFGQLGNNNTTNLSNVNQVGSGTTWSKIGASQYATFAIKTDGTLWSWGRNYQGQLGLNDSVYRSSPTQVGSGTTWSQVFGGINHVLAIKTDGTLWAWGNNGQGQLGRNAPGGNDVSSPVQVGTGTNWSKVFPFSHSAMGVTSN
jgi:alpha-tubulin suppressor-like RCC1 family protein